MLQPEAQQQFAGRGAERFFERVPERIVIRELANRLAKLPFPVKHLQTRDTLFPVSSTMRASNTALAEAQGELIVSLPDHAVAPPDFLQDHWDL